MSYTSIRTAIASKLSGITSIASVHLSHTENPAGFPAASFEPSSHENIIFTNTDNLRSHNFDIVLYQEYTTIDRDTAVGLLCGVADDVITAFDTDYNLGGACDFCLALPGSWGEFTGSNGKIIYAMLTLTAKKEVDVS